MKLFYPIVFPLTLVLAVGAAAQQSDPAAPSGSGSTSFHEQSATERSALAPAKAQPKPTAEPPDPLLDVPPMPKGNITLIGGTVRNVDHVRDKLVVQVFGGQTMKISFDERTHIYRDDVETTQLGIRNGERVYVDTMLDGSRVFARNIHVETGAHAADSAGQVLSVNTREGTITLQDRLSAQPVRFHVAPKTSVTRDKEPVSFTEVKPGALVAVKFAPERANRGVAREISIIAAPGMQFTFVGRVTNLDLRSGVLSVENQTDGKTYDLNFNLGRVDKRDALGIGSEVTILATFEGWGYRANSVTVMAGPEAGKTKQ